MAYKLSISITQNSQSVANNTSNVTVKVNCSWTYGTWSAENLEKYVTINGTKYSFSSTDINPNATTSGSSTLFTKTLDIAHNADGTGKVDVYAYTKTTTSSGTQTASASKTLTTIARKSTVSATNKYIEDNCLITISRKSSKFTHTLKYTFGSLSGTIATKTTATNVNFIFPVEFYGQLGSTGTSKKGTITCETFNGSTSLGTNSCTFTAYANPQNSHPTLSGAKVTPDQQTIDLTGNKKTIIRYCTDAAVTIGAAARYSATLSSKSCTNGGKKLTADGTFTNVTSGKFEFYAKDSRGYTYSYTENLTVVPYVKLTCNLDVRIGVDGVANVTIKGNYFNDSFGAADNFITPQFRYKQLDGEYSSWMYCNPSLSGNTYTAEGEEYALDYQTTYIFQARATDTMGTVTTKEIEVKAEPIFDWGENDFKFNVDVAIKNNMRIYGTTTDKQELNAFQPCNGNNNCVIGYGGYDHLVGATNLYGNDVNVLTNTNFTVNDGNDVYSLLGAVKAMTTVYELDCSVTLGDNYSSGSATAFLIGNNLRMYMTATRNSNSSTGDILNETVMTIKVNHNGKVKSMYGTGFASATTGAPATLNAATSRADENNYNIVVRLCGVAIADNGWSGYWSVPCSLNLDAYV